MPLSIRDICKYAQLATASYVDLSDANDFTGKTLGQRANAQKRMPESFGQDFFVDGGWQVLNDPRFSPSSHNDPAGFAATLFQKN